MKGCIPIANTVDIYFEDTTVQDIRLSPFEDDKIWIKFSNRLGEIREIDIKTNRQTILEKKYGQFFFSNNHDGRIDFQHQDQYDAIVWLCGYNKKVEKYDKRTKLIQELDVKYVTRIISKPDKVYFVSQQGFCYWDRNKKVIEQVDGIPVEFIQTSVMPNDSVIILDAKYTYNFNTHQVRKGVYLDEYEHRGEFYSFKAQNGIKIFREGDSIWLATGNEIQNLPLPFASLDNTKIINLQVWQSDNDYFYRYDTESGKTKKYPYRLPVVNTYATNYQVDDKHIWIQRPGQFEAINLKDSRQYDYPIRNSEGHIRSIVDDCNVYILYKNRLLIESKDKFISRCTLFNASGYELKLKLFNTLVDSIGIRSDTSQSSALAKLNYLKSVFSNSGHVEIARSLSGLESMGFQSVQYAFPEGYEQCYMNTQLPIVQRKRCILAMVDKYGRSSDFKKVIQLEGEFLKYFGTPDRNTDYYFISEVDSVKRYLSTVDSLEKMGMPRDSLSFYKALALGAICRTHWYCSEGCGGCDFSLVVKALNNLIIAYPQSELKDNAELYLINLGFIHDYGEDESLLAKVKEYEKFIINHRKSDLMPDIRYSIFENLTYMQTLNRIEIKNAGQKFIREFSTDKRVRQVEQKLTELEIK